MTKDYFIRHFELESIHSTLRFYQKIEGDVSCVVWDAAIVLAKYIENLFLGNADVFKNKLIIELGAGVGCVGITAACFGAKVILTDLQQTIPLLNENIKCNSKVWKKLEGSAIAALLNWGQKLDNSTHKDSTPDIILMADCIYYIESVLPLVETLRQSSSAETTIFLSQELRDSDKQKECWKYFEEVAGKYFTFHLIPLSEQSSEYSCPEIVIFKLKLIR